MITYGYISKCRVIIVIQQNKYFIAIYNMYKR